MSEIEKLYENAGVEKAPDFNNCYPEMLKCHHCEHYKVIDEYTGRCLNEVYPEFTAEKQLELIKWLAQRLDFGLEYYQDKTWAVQTQLGWDGYEKQKEHKNFEEALSGLINTLWQDLTETEKAEIKEILK